MVTPAQTSRRFLASGDTLGKHAVIRQIAVGEMAELYLTRTVGIEGFARDSQLRVSPLVVARLMSTLFPARLESGNTRAHRARVSSRSTWCAP